MSAKSKKKGEKVLMLPGAAGWEAWTGVNGGGLNLAMRSGEKRALDVDGLPSGELSMAFPVRDVSALPFLAPTTDEALFPDMADLHIERLGLRPGANAGMLTDCFRVGMREESSLLLPVVLAPPPEGHLPKRSPQSFDISARCLPLPEEGVVMWRELGRWVFAVAEGGQPLHFQALAATQLGEDAGREVRISVSQLEIQGLLQASPQHCLVWVGTGEEPPLPAELEDVARGFRGTVDIAEKPAPVMPRRASHLLPADVRAERLAKRKKQQMTAAVVVAAVAYLGLIGWAFWTLRKEQQAAAAAKREFDEIQPYVMGIQEHKRKWAELALVVEDGHWPVELLLLCSKARSDQDGLRLERAQFQAELKVLDGKLVPERSITLHGTGDELGQVNTFSFNLTGSDGLQDYNWSTPPAILDPKSDRWEFTYIAKNAQAE